SSTIRTARSRTSGEYLFDVFRFSIAPSYSRVGASGIPGAVHYREESWVGAWEDVARASFHPGTGSFRNLSDWP
ncbi:hypothetical protein, partial [Acidiphilium iwatense]